MARLDARRRRRSRGGQILRRAGVGGAGRKGMLCRPGTVG